MSNLDFCSHSEARTASKRMGEIEVVKADEPELCVEEKGNCCRIVLTFKYYCLLSLEFEKSKHDEEQEIFDFSVYEEGQTKYSDNFGSKPGQLGCFGLILMYFVHKNQEKARKNHKSLISRNRGFKTGIKRSVRKLQERTMSMISLASTNWRQSRMNLAGSMANLAAR